MNRSILTNVLKKSYVYKCFDHTWQELNVSFHSYLYSQHTYLYKCCDYTYKDLNVTFHYDHRF
jgi:hypothetical protein